MHTVGAVQILEVRELELQEQRSLCASGELLLAQAKQEASDALRQQGRQLACEHAAQLEVQQQEVKVRSNDGQPHVTNPGACWPAAVLRLWWRSVPRP